MLWTLQRLKTDLQIHEVFKQKTLQNPVRKYHSTLYQLLKMMISEFQPNDVTILQLWSFRPKKPTRVSAMATMKNTHPEPDFKKSLKTILSSCVTVPFRTVLTKNQIWDRPKCLKKTTPKTSRNTSFNTEMLCKSYNRFDSTKL